MWMGNLVRTDVHNNQPNKPGYTQIRNRLWGLVYTDNDLRNIYSAQCEVGGVWEFRLHCKSYRTRRWNDFCGTIRWKISHHNYRSLIADEEISSSNGRTIYFLEKYDWEAALQDFNADAYNQLRASWMMHLMKNAS